MAWRIPLSRPVVGKSEESAVLKVLRSGKLANGPLADRFAQKVAEFHGLAHGVAVSSGTLGLELALRALGVGPGDRVAVPAYTFVASANAILAVGAEPVFVDVDENGLMDPCQASRPILRGDGVKAAVVVDLFGGVAREAGDVFRKAKIPVVEDACEAFGAAGVGYGDLVVFGFYPNKVITTGEGGVVCRPNRTGHGSRNWEKDLVREMRNHGRPVDWHWGHGWGTNARMSEIHAALGLAQMKRAKALLRAREQVARWYHEMLPKEFRALPFDGRPWFVFPVWSEFMEGKQSTVEILTAAGIETGEYFPFLPSMPQFNSFDRGPCPTAKRLSETGFALPFHPGLTRREVAEVCRTMEYPF